MYGRLIVILIYSNHDFISIKSIFSSQENIRIIFESFKVSIGLPHFFKKRFSFNINEEMCPKGDFGPDELFQSHCCFPQPFSTTSLELLSSKVWTLNCLTFRVKKWIYLGNEDPPHKTFESIFLELSKFSKKNLS